MNWDEYFMRHVYLAASKSKDPRTKIGAVLVKDGIIISEGFNGFPRGVEDSESRYNNRTIKWDYIVHGEHNAILNTCRHGIKTLDSTLYTQGIPCNECSKAIIQAGIKEIVIHKQWPNLLSSEKWVEAVRMSKIMLGEANITLRQLDSVLGVVGYLDGTIINV